MGFKVDISGVLQGLVSAEVKTRAAIGLYADSVGTKLEAYAKEDAPWQDRSHSARDTITGGYRWHGNKCTIYVCGNMEYSVYLELCHEKKYAVLWPTIERLQPDILRGFGGILDRG